MNRRRIMFWMFGMVLIALAIAGCFTTAPGWLLLITGCVGYAITDAASTRLFFR